MMLLKAIHNNNFIILFLSMITIIQKLLCIRDPNSSTGTSNSKSTEEREVASNNLSFYRFIFTLCI